MGYFPHMKNVIKNKHYGSIVELVFFAHCFHRPVCCVHQVHRIMVFTFLAFPCPCFGGHGGHLYLHLQYSNKCPPFPPYFPHTLRIFSVFLWWTGCEDCAMRGYSLSSSFFFHNRKILTANAAPLAKASSKTAVSAGIILLQFGNEQRCPQL